MKKVWSLIALCGVLCSCMSEKMLDSPLVSALQTENSINNTTPTSAQSVEMKLQMNTLAAELTNILSTMPKFGQKEVDSEISVLKGAVVNYMYAWEAKNKAGEARYQDQILKSYTKIQKLRKKLDPEQDQRLNVYLVKIKTNLNGMIQK